jgi:hypothetical protein
MSSIEPVLPYSLLHGGECFVIPLEDANNASSPVKVLTAKSSSTAQVISCTPALLFCSTHSPSGYYLLIITKRFLLQ